MRFKKAGIIEEEKASGVAAKAQRDTRALLDSGREQGHLTADEIAGALVGRDGQPLEAGLRATNGNAAPGSCCCSGRQRC
jgi:hypothetical protein